MTGASSTDCGACTYDGCFKARVSGWLHCINASFVQEPHAAVIKAPVVGAAAWTAAQVYEFCMCCR